MKPVAVLALALGIGGLILPAQWVGAGVYRFTDENGDIHFVDSAEKIPEAYRDKATDQQTQPVGSGQVSVVPDGEAASATRSDSPPRPGSSKNKKCGLSFVRRDRKEEGSTLTYLGTVVNRGTGTARVVQVTLQTFDKKGKILDSTTTYTQPKDLGPNETGSFEIALDAGKRERQTRNVEYKGSKFDTSFTRCD